jgi:hypothetical protein
VSLNEVPTYWLRNLRSSERSRGQQRTARGKALGAERSADCGRKRARQANSRAGLPSEAGVQARYKRLAVTHATTINLLSTLSIGFIDKGGPLPRVPPLPAPAPPGAS